MNVHLELITSKFNAKLNVNLDTMNRSNFTLTLTLWNITIIHFAELHSFGWLFAHSLGVLSFPRN